ncbi:MAG: hypothetical protein KKE37_05625 [Verrucomicrobia bacterium]|nr:hypothetical protein [Verrucomicrobiota bacterium]MBU4291235.1 hypothetical protein [Verrucomicrobiota bacterium]MBU4428817.1 hypothetical protein [Verrucomicrobiota bacterium]
MRSFRNWPGFRRTRGGGLANLFRRCLFSACGCPFPLIGNGARIRNDVGLRHDTLIGHRLTIGRYTFIDGLLAVRLSVSHGWNSTGLSNYGHGRQPSCQPPKKQKHPHHISHYSTLCYCDCVTVAEARRPSASLTVTTFCP